jgi:hypothetical protein
MEVISAIGSSLKRKSAQANWLLTSLANVFAGVRAVPYCAFAFVWQR